MEAGTGETGLQDLETADDELETMGTAEPVDALEPEDLTQEILNESVDETAKRVSAALKEEPAAKHEPDPGHAGTQAQSRARGPDGKFLARQQPATPEAQQQQLAQDVEAPQRFSPAAREAWKVADPVLRQEYAKLVRDSENGQLAKMRELHQVKSQADTIVNAVSPWAKDWAANGIAVPQGVALLAQTHENLIKDPVNTLAQLVKDNGVSIQDVAAVLDGRAPNGAGNGTGLDIERHPVVADLRSQLNRINNQMRQEQERVTVEQSTAKVRALADEKNADGSSRYPGILDAGFLQKAQPLVVRLRTPTRGANGETIPGMDIVEAYKAAHAYLAPPAHTPQVNLNGNQPLRQPAQPLLMRPRSAPLGGATPAPEVEISPAILRETPDETLARLRKQRGANY